MELSIKRLRELVDYNPDTGLFIWRYQPDKPKRWNTRCAGKEALCCSDRQGYKQGAIARKTYKAHRVAWAHYYGEWPTENMDHINHDRADNRIVNLRLATVAENNRNTKMNRKNTSGTMGVVWNCQRNKWQARVKIQGRQVSLGLFVDKDEAIAARKDAEWAYGFHENHGT